jgi:hypothetical protein
MNCQYCGVSLPRNTSICPKCGAPVTSEPLPPPAPPIGPAQTTEPGWERVHSEPIRGRSTPEIIPPTTSAELAGRQQHLSKWARTAFTLGIVSLVTACTLPAISLPIPIIGLVYGFNGLKSEVDRPKATSGLILSGIGLALNLIWVLVIIGNVIYNSIEGSL